LSGADPVSELPLGAPQPRRTGLRLRIAATVGMVVLAGLSVARHASASFDQPSIPIGDVASLDGIVSGTVRLSGNRLVFFSGDRFRSNQSNLAVNFASGGSLVLCPHSQVQILGSQKTGVMLAFAEGGSEEPFPVHPGDVVMTPDWRIEMVGDVHPGNLAELQLSTTRRGDLCLSSAAQTSAYFHISQLVGDATFDFPGQGSVRIANGAMETYPAGCSCESSSSTIEASGAEPPAASLSSAAQPVATSPVPPAMLPLAAPSPANSDAISKRKQRPQDVAGYVRSFVHVIFGR